MLSASIKRLASSKGYNLLNIRGGVLSSVSSSSSSIHTNSYYGQHHLTLSSSLLIQSSSPLLSISESTRHYSNKSKHFNRRNSYTRKQDVRAGKKRESIKEATQRGEEPVKHRHSKLSHEHTLPLSHEEKLELKKKSKKERKEQIRLNNQERIKHVNQVEEDQRLDREREEQARLDLKRSITNPSATQLPFAMQQDIVDEVAEEEDDDEDESSYTSSSELSSSDEEWSSEEDEDQSYEEFQDDDNEEELEEFQDDAEIETNQKQVEKDDDEDTPFSKPSNMEDVRNFFQGYHKAKANFQGTYTPIPREEFDITKIDPTKVITLTPEMIEELTKDQEDDVDDDELPLPQFITHEDAKRRFGFTDEELRSTSAEIPDDVYEQLLIQQQQELDRLASQGHKINIPSYATADPITTTQFPPPITVDKSAVETIDTEKEKEKEKKKKEKKEKKESKKAASSSSLIMEEELEKGDEYVDFKLEKENAERKKKKKETKNERKKRLHEEEIKEFESIEELVAFKQKEQKEKMLKDPKKKHLVTNTGEITMQEVMDVLAETKLEDFFVVDISNKCTFTKYLVVASSDSNRVLANAEEDLLSTFKHRFAKGHEPTNPADESDDWRAIDLGICMIHLFETSRREYYDLETLWATRRPVGTVEQSWDDEKTDLIGEKVIDEKYLKED